MEQNVSFAHERYEGAEGAKLQKDLWENLTSILNAQGGPIKTIEQWKQYLRDLRRNVKAKAADIKKQREQSGINGFRKLKTLDNFERRLLGIMTVDAVDGDGESPEIGFNLPTPSYNDVAGVENIPPQINQDLVFGAPSNRNNADAIITADIDAIIADNTDVNIDANIDLTKDNVEDRTILSELQIGTHSGSAKHSDNLTSKKQVNQGSIRRSKTRNAPYESANTVSMQKYIALEEKKLEFEERKFNEEKRLQQEKSDFERKLAMDHLEIKKQTLELEKERIKIESQKVEKMNDISNLLKTYTEYMMNSNL